MFTSYVKAKPFKIEIHVDLDVKVIKQYFRTMGFILLTESSDV